MKGSVGLSRPCLSLKLVSDKVGSLLCCHGSPNKYSRLDSKLETKVLEVKRNAPATLSIRSINALILKFPHFREGLKEIRTVFEQFDEDSNGAIDREELKKCLQKLQFHVGEEEIDELFRSCDVDDNEKIKFNEFIVLLCLIYLLMDAPSSGSTSKIGSPVVESTFNTIVEAFLFLDKNGDGKLHKKDVVKAFNDAFPLEKSPSHVTRTRFKEMDWDRSGKISFRKFLFAFLDWVGIDGDDEDHMAEI
ncbi:PREDICTED: probable calcium-binding protein CML22 [Ipomoea nil]|uniref:probable calcium-binding protein CML22 n=1 Tax=Ipomoea nil TaxID=35883 RepID=UPI0009012E95|nr:PREDICTED: probable calcium-binding protein CML22 [Ipomoea nil]